MPFPPGVQTVTLTGHQTLADGDGRPLPVKIRPTPGRVVGAEWGVVVDNDPVVVTPDNAGQWTKTLVATDAAGFSPTGWTYRVETGGDAVYVSLPHSLGEVDLSELIPAGADEGEYVLVPGPSGAPGASAYDVAVANGFVGSQAQWLLSLVGAAGSPGEPGDPGSPGAPGAAGAAGHTPQLYSGAAAPTTLHADGDLYLRTNGDLYQQAAGAWGSPVGNLLGPKGDKGDQGDPGVSPSLDGVVLTTGDQVISGEKTFNDAIPVAPAFDPEFDNQLTRKAYVDARVAAGGGSSIVSFDGRIDVQIVVPQPVTGWAIVTTSGGVEIGYSVPAAVGDRIWFSPSFLRTFGIFLDMGIKAAGGGVSRYVSSGTATPEPDGYAPLYPEVAFAGVAGIRQFVVQAGEVDGSGNAKIVLAYRGNSADGSSRKVYFGGGPGYSGAIFVANMGPAPA